MGSLQAGLLFAVRVLSRLFRRLLLDKLAKAHQAGQLNFFGDHKQLAASKAFTAWLKPLRRAEWVVYAKQPFAGPQAVLAYLSRYTHRVAIANSRPICLDDNGVAFKWKDYRTKGRERQKVMTLKPHEFIRRFLIHVLPAGFHRIRHYGLFANGGRAHNIARARELLATPMPITQADDQNGARDSTTNPYPCPHCSGRMLIIETFERHAQPRAPPTHRSRTS